MMQPRKAFTLMELLVVMGIIAILGGMIFAGVQVAKASALKTKTTNTLNQVAGALLSYRNLSGSYPDTHILGGKTYLDVFQNGSGTVRTAKEIEADQTANGWILANQLMIDQLNLAGQQFTSPIKDAWGGILRYRPSKHYPFLTTSPDGIRIDEDQNVPGRDSYQLWSIGRDQKNQYGQAEFPVGKKGDDLTSWSQ